MGEFFILCSLFLASMEQTLTELQDISTTRQEDLRTASPKPYLCWENHGCSFSLCDIDSGIELCYDYGGSALPWRQVIATYFCKFIIYVYSIQLIVA